MHLPTLPILVQSRPLHGHLLLQPATRQLTSGSRTVLPKGRLDQIPIPGLMGCEVQRQKVAAVKPLICVFGHFHVSYGVERVVWGNGADDGISNATIVTDDGADGSL
jgi:hypothetical protein